MGNTVLTSQPTKEQLARDSAEELDWERFTILLDICYEHYIEPTTKADLARFCRLLVDISDDFSGDEIDQVPSRGRDRLIGERVYKAVRYDQNRTAGNTPVSNKTVFRKLVNDLVDLAHEREGRSKNKTEQTSTTPAFKFVAKLLYKYGITNNGKEYSASTISDWCDSAKTAK
jgi:hypothetical protein